MNHSRSDIELKNLGLLRQDRWILRDINWTVTAGTCAAILGPNGSGKSTLARVIAGYVWPTTGQATILGQPFGQTNLPELRHSIRLVQPAGPYDIDASLTALEVVCSGFTGTLWLYDPETPEMQTRARELLDQVGLAQVADHPYATLSSGERVRSLIARALVTRPGLLILDEPTAGLDLLAREQVLATVDALFRTKQPPTVVMITHHVEELPPATQSVLLLDNGATAAQGAPQSVLRSEILSAVYRCPLQVRQEAGRYYVQVHPAGWGQLLART